MSQDAVGDRGNNIFVVIGALVAPQKGPFIEIISRDYVALFHQLHRCFSYRHTPICRTPERNCSLIDPEE